MKGKHANKTKLPTGSGSQKRSFSGSSSGSRPHHPNKKAKYNPNQNQKNNNHNATTSPGNQAKTAHTAAQVYKRDYVIPGPSRSDKTGFTPVKQETARSSPILPKETAFTPTKQIKSASTPSKKGEPGFTVTKQEKDGFAPIPQKNASSSPIFKTTLAAANAPTKARNTELTNTHVNKEVVAKDPDLNEQVKAKVASNKAEITNKKTMADNSSKVEVNVDEVTALSRRNSEFGTAKSESECSSSSSSDSKEGNIDDEQPGSGSGRTLQKVDEIANSMSESGLINDEDKESTLPVKAKAISTQSAKLRNICSSSSESGSSDEERDMVAVLAKVKTTPAKIANVKLVHNPFNDTNKNQHQPNMNTDLKIISTPHPKTKQVHSPSSESGYDSDVDEERPTIKTGNEPTQTPQPRIEEVDTSSSGSASDNDDDDEINIKAKIEDVSTQILSKKTISQVEEHEAVEAEDEREDADTSSKESSVNYPSSAASTSGLSNGPKSLLPLSSANGKPCSLTVEVTPSVCSSGTRGFSKSPQPQASQKSEPSKITNPTGKGTNEHSFLESVQVDMRQEREASVIAQIPVWFSQKVRKILEGPNFPDTMEFKVIISIPSSLSVNPDTQ
jgi:hypothetical protein